MPGAHQSPGRGAAGHVHDVEMDQMVGANYLVTVHGLPNAGLEPGAAMIETATATVTGRLDAGRVRPASRTPCPTR